MSTPLLPACVDERSAWLDGDYRYSLRRAWGDSGRCTFVMLNPSTADATQDDPTIRRCLGFARRLGCGELVVVNLYAWRATDPAALRRASDPFGPHNFAAVAQAACDAKYVVAAWGVNAQPEPALYARRLLNEYGKVYALGFTKDGHPRHPLYVKADAPLVEWPLAALKSRSPRAGERGGGE